METFKLKSAALAWAMSVITNLQLVLGWVNQSQPRWLFHYIKALSIVSCSLKTRKHGLHLQGITFRWLNSRIKVLHLVVEQGLGWFWWFCSPVALWQLLISVCYDVVVQNAGMRCQQSTLRSTEIKNQASFFVHGTLRVFLQCVVGLDSKLSYGACTSCVVPPRRL